ncbi:MAG TPA: TetR/AcrR family transcriptional regulator [Burkholderiaceae bacterium]|nr:TetR/AcrR family transcriptional regulator [Burkholderiaceae bacterium]
MSEPSLDPAGAPAARPRRRTQAERREEAERRLLDAALEVVARRGSVRMTLAEVGEVAGYSRGLAAHRFGNKAGLLRALVAHIGARFREQREAGPPSKPGLDSIRRSISVYFSRTEQSWISTRALLVMMTEGFMEDSDLREHVTAYTRSARSFFEQQIRHGVASGEIAPDIDPKSTAVILLGAMRGVMLQRLNDNDIDLLEVRDRMLAIVDRMLGRR